MCYLSHLLRLFFTLTTWCPCLWLIHIISKSVWLVYFSICFYSTSVLCYIIWKRRLRTKISTRFPTVCILQERVFFSSCDQKWIKTSVWAARYLSFSGILLTVDLSLRMIASRSCLLLYVSLLLLTASTTKPHRPMCAHVVVALGWARGGMFFDPWVSKHVVMLLKLELFV